MMVTVEPAGTLLPGCGSWSMTVPSGCVLSAPDEFTLNPRLSSLDRAVAWSLPVTSGTLLPLDAATTRSTDVPLATDAPPLGSWPTTVPGVWPEDPSSSVTLPTVSPAPVISERAVSTSLPVTSGTVTLVMPLLTYSVMVSPDPAFVPAFGAWRTTVPISLSLSTRSVTTSKPACSSDAWASSMASPTTLGTVTSAGPDDTSTVTAESLASSVPASGWVPMTTPICTVSLACVRCVGLRPASLRVLRAAGASKPATSGTAIMSEPPRVSDSASATAMAATMTATMPHMARRLPPPFFFAPPRPPPRPARPPPDASPNAWVSIVAAAPVAAAAGAVRMSVDCWPPDMSARTSSSAAVNSSADQ